MERSKKAYKYLFQSAAKIMLINSGLCMLAFAILKNPYAIVLGIIIGIIDALPVFGTGTVLIPWILISFLIRNYRYAVILLMAYIITYFVREIMESRVWATDWEYHHLQCL